MKREMPADFFEMVGRVRKALDKIIPEEIYSDIVNMWGDPFNRSVILGMYDVGLSSPLYVEDISRVLKQEGYKIDWGHLCKSLEYLKSKGVLESEYREGDGSRYMFADGCGRYVKYVLMLEKGILGEIKKDKELQKDVSETLKKLSRNQPELEGLTLEDCTRALLIYALNTPILNNPQT